jgi:rod shape-determining protein MreD
MVDQLARDRLAHRLAFVLAAFAVVFLHLLPFGLGKTHIPGPDILTLLAFAWVVRRPDYVPALLVALVTLFTDVIFVRPLGLWAALVLIGLEFLRTRESLSRDQPFLVEWFMVGATFCLITMANSLILAVFLVPQPPLKLAALQMVISVGCYPAIALATRYLFGVRRLGPGDTDAMGHRT